MPNPKRPRKQEKTIKQRLSPEKSEDTTAKIHPNAEIKIVLDFAKMNPKQIAELMKGLKDMSPAQIAALVGGQQCYSIEKLIRASEKRQGLFALGIGTLGLSVAFVFYGLQQSQLSLVFTGVFLWLVAVVLFTWVGRFGKRD